MTRDYTTKRFFSSSTLVSTLMLGGALALAACSNPPPPPPPPPPPAPANPLPALPQLQEGADRPESLERLRPQDDPSLSPEAVGVEANDEGES